MDISHIKPYSKNAKKHPKKQVEQVAASIKEFGFNQPIVIDKNGVIIDWSKQKKNAKAWLSHMFMEKLMDVKNVIVWDKQVHGYGKIITWQK